MPVGGSNLELFVNDLSIEGQFADIPAFCRAIDTLMVMRQLAKQYGRDVYCHRGIANKPATHDWSFYQAIQRLDLNQRRVLMQWLTNHGPFWEDVRQHSSDDYFTCGEEPVTDSAVAEAAYCAAHGIGRHLVSLQPSSWGYTPLLVEWVQETGDNRLIELTNHWQQASLKTSLEAARAPIESWEQLAEHVKANYTHLTFFPDCFDELSAYPFVASAAHQIGTRLDVLNGLKNCFDAQGKWTQEGNSLYQTHFTGDRAWFSDSSATEKHEFSRELTFRNPTASLSLSCTWHGKVNTPNNPLRIHFSWPVCADQPLYIAYIGPKITKR